VAELFDLLLAVPAGRRQAVSYIAAFFGTKRRLYGAAAAVMQQKVDRAMQVRLDAVSRLKELWAKLDAEATDQMKSVRLALRRLQLSRGRT
jgi:hypothetical protein